jgi:hypothetical protein
MMAVAVVRVSQHTGAGELQQRCFCWQLTDQSSRGVVLNALILLPLLECILQCLSDLHMPAGNRAAPWSTWLT